MTRTTEKIRLLESVLYTKRAIRTRHMEKRSKARARSRFSICVGQTVNELR